MTTTVAETGFHPQAFEQFLSARREPSWLTDLRRRAWRAFRELDLPDSRSEEWRRTDIRLLRLDRFGLAAVPAPTVVEPEALLAANVELAGRTASLDTHVQTAELGARWSAQGVMFGSLDDLLAEHGDLFRPYLTRRIVDPRVDKFAALSGACWSGGTLLYVPRGVAIDRPLHTFSGLSPGGVDLGRTLVVLDEGAEATLLAETGSLEASGAGLHCGTTEIIVGPGARLRYVGLQNWGTGVWHFAHQKAVVERGGRLQWTIGALGSRLAKVNQHVVLAGRDADVQVNGVMFTEGKQHLSYHTLQHHREPYCHSDFLYKGALQDRSHLVWRGMIKVDPGCDKTDAYQRDDNLLLSESARADSIPGLEIEADDVRCSHGATAGRVDDEQIFYAQNRGLTRKEAVRMIVAGFFQQVFDRITIDSVRDALGDAIRRRVREYQ